jgi:AraC family transcriptional activator of pobA
MAQQIPTHDLYNQLEGAIAFEYVTLEEKQNYDPLHYHRHSYYEIFVFEKGGGRHEIDFQIFGVNTRAVHVVSPGQVHMLQRELDSRGNVVLFSREFYQVGLIHEDHLYQIPFLNNNSTRPIIEIPDNQWPRIKGFFDAIGEEYARKESDSEAMIRGYLNLLLVELKRIFIEQNEAQHVFNQQHDLVRRFRIEIEQRFSEWHKPSDYADKLCVTVGHLNDKVKAALGLTASQLIHERLLLEIKRMLLFQEQQISEIAHALNFEDSSYFNRFFKQQTGQTPLDFRKSIRDKYFAA